MFNKRNRNQFLCALFDNGGELSRKNVLQTVFQNNVTRLQLDAFLASPELSDLFYVIGSPQRDRFGKRLTRNVTTYYLTVAGWKFVLSGLRKGVTPRKLNTKAVQEQFERILAEGDVWATQLTKDAQNGRQREEDWLEAKRKEVAERHEHNQGLIAARKSRRAAKAGAEAKAREARDAQENPNRMPALPVFGTDTHIGTRQPSVAEPVRPAVPKAPAVSDFRSSIGWPSHIPTTRDSTPRIPAGLAQTRPSKSLALAERIRKAGYTVKDGRVQFNGNEWLTPEEWQRRMPGVLD